MKKYGVSIFILIFMMVSTLTFASGDRVSLGYIYNSSKSHTEIVNDTNGNINTVSPTCFDLTDDGHLFINNIFDQEFVNNMHEQGVKVTPFLSNHWGRKKAQAALAKSEILASEVAEAVMKYNLDGVNVDLENLQVKDKDKLTDFVRILREKLPEEKIVSVAVAANPKKLTKTWIAAYDYVELAKHADYLVLMAYDEHSAGGSEGPVASIGFVEESVKVILENVSRDKVVLGIPLYGRYWQNGAERGGEAVVIAQVERISARYKKSIPVYDEETGTVKVTIDVESGDKKAYINGRYLEEGTYTIWYENENSISRKLQVMNQYGLRGAGLWALGNENDEFWKYYSKGFSHDEYESEESINERAHYEFVEMMIQTAEPIKLVGEFKYNKNEIQRNTPQNMTQKNINYMLNKKINLNKVFSTNGKLVEKEKYYKKIDNISFTHIVKRYNLDNK